MGESKAIWDMIDAGLVGDNVNLVVKNENCKVMQLADETGEGIMTMYKVFDGVYLMYNDFHMERCYSGFQTGIAEESIREMMPAFEIDIKTLLNKFCKADGVCVLAQDASIDNLFTQLYRLPEKAQPYFYKSQVEKIHGIRKLITEDLSENYTQEELSRRFEISLTPMKQCFKSTYGQSIYKYLREYRMNRAAEMLLTEPGKKVTDIAAACGYENPGKFGQAFREQFGVAPLEYRRSNGRRS